MKYPTWSLTEVSVPAKGWGFRLWGPLWPNLLSSMGEFEIGPFNKRTPRRDVTFTPLTPYPQHSTHSLASHYTDMTRISHQPHPSGEGQQGPQPGTHPTQQPPQMPGFTWLWPLSHTTFWPGSGWDGCPASRHALTPLSSSWRGWWPSGQGTWSSGGGAAAC